MHLADAAKRAASESPNPADIEKAATSLFGKTLVTHQTGPEGIVVRKLYVERTPRPAFSAKSSISPVCLTALADVRSSSRARPTNEGGMDIEELARTKPEALFYEPVNPVSGLSGYQARNLAQRMGLKGAALVSVAGAAVSIAKAFLLGTPRWWK